MNRIGIKDADVVTEQAERIIDKSAEAGREENHQTKQNRHGKRQKARSEKTQTGQKNQAKENQQNSSYEIAGKGVGFVEYFQSIRDQLMKGQLPLFCSQCNPSQVAGNRRIREALKNYL